MEIGKHIYSRRRALGMTQAELAAELGVTPQFVSALEKGVSSPSLPVLVKLAARLGTTTDFLLSGYDRPPLDITAVIRADKTLTPTAKRALITLVTELQAR